VLQEGEREGGGGGGGEEEEELCYLLGKTNENHKNPQFV
jgi:hypothetical protein